MKKPLIIGIIVLLIASLSCTPALGSIGKGETTVIETKQMVTLDLFDTTGSRPVRNQVQITRVEWNMLRQEFREIRERSDTFADSLRGQIVVMQEYGLLSEDVCFEDVMDRFEGSVRLSRFGIDRTPIINNSAFNAMCAIDFELTNGTTVVLGLNTFINYIGFDIFSVHKGYAVNGIDTKGLLDRATPAGEYVGFMFGFLGYWLGEMDNPGFYSNMTAAGFTVITGWVPLPDLS